MAASYDDAVGELYRAAHDAFVTERKRLAGELKAAGDKAGAARFAKLARPPISAWAVNQLWWQAREPFERLFAAARRLRAGDQGGASERRDAIAGLKARAAALLEQAGHAASEGTLRRVTTTLSALAATGGFEPDLPGALAADRDPPGFDAAALGAFGGPGAALDATPSHSGEGGAAGDRASAPAGDSSAASRASSSAASAAAPSPAPSRGAAPPAARPASNGPASNGPASNGPASKGPASKGAASKATIIELDPHRIESARAAREKAELERAAREREARERVERERQEREREERELSERLRAEQRRIEVERAARRAERERLEASLPALQADLERREREVDRLRAELARVQGLAEAARTSIRNAQTRLIELSAGDG